MHYQVFICRAQPAHAGHHAVIKAALADENFSTKLIIVLGSRTGVRTLKNPFRADERREIIRSMLTEEDLERVIFTEVYDTTYNNNAWVENVQRAVYQAISDDDNRPANCKISLIGHSKDKSSFYLKLFPDWHNIEVPDFKGLNATDLREVIYSAGIDFTTDFIEKYFVNDKHYDTVHQYLSTPWFKQLDEEYEFIEVYKSKWGDRQWNTVDSVVTLGGHILLVQRGKFPGKGSWALPGGFLNRDERIVDAAVRELREETMLAVPAPVLYGSIDAHDVYDVPDRDPRGRIITHAFHFNMVNYGSFDKGDIRLPKIKGSDDAVKAKWFTLREFEDMKESMFGDHYDIAKDLMGRASRKWS